MQSANILTKLPKRKAQELLSEKQGQRQISKIDMLRGTHQQSIVGKSVHMTYVLNMTLSKTTCTQKSWFEAQCFTWAISIVGLCSNDQTTKNLLINWMKQVTKAKISKKGNSSVITAFWFLLWSLSTALILWWWFWQCKQVHLWFSNQWKRTLLWKVSWPAMLTISHALLNSLIICLVMFIEHGNCENDNILSGTQKRLKRFRQKQLQNGSDHWNSDNSGKLTNHAASCNAWCSEVTFLIMCKIPAGATSVESGTGAIWNDMMWQIKEKWSVKSCCF
jgi:hypothetical protein